VLRGAAGAGAAGIAATALAGTAGQALAAPAKPVEPAQPAPHDTDVTSEPENEQLVVHVRDAHSGQLDIFHGTSAVEVHDTDLAARLVRASKQVK
jgi:hypothetical protein